MWQIFTAMIQMHADTDSRSLGTTTELMLREQAHNAALTASPKQARGKKPIPTPRKHANKRLQPETGDDTIYENIGPIRQEEGYSMEHLRVMESTTILPEEEQGAGVEAEDDQDDSGIGNVKEWIAGMSCLEKDNA